MSPSRAIRRYPSGSGRRRFSTSISSSASIEESSSEFSDSYSSDDETSPRDRVLANSKGFKDFRIKDLKLSAYGRKEIEIAEQEMPGLMLLRKKTCECESRGEKPLKGAKIVGCTHITAQAAVSFSTF